MYGQDCSSTMTGSRMLKRGAQTSTLTKCTRPADNNIVVPIGMFTSLAEGFPPVDDSPRIDIFLGRLHPRQGSLLVLFPE